MTIVVPPFEVVNAIETGQCVIKRRIAIYEVDGETPWYPDQDDPETLRLVDGSVTVDSTRAERRMMDLTLQNRDNKLRPDPNQGFWYDKVIKAYRGVEYVVPLNGPKITIVETVDPYDSQKFTVMLRSLGLTRSFIDPTVTNWNDADSDVLISYTKTVPTAKANLLLGQYAAGRGVLTFSVGNTEAEVPGIASTASVGSQSWGVTPVNADTPVAGQWVAGTAATVTPGEAIVDTAAGALAVAEWSGGGGPTTITGTVQSNAAGGRWVDLHLPDFDSPGILQLVKACILWLQDYTPVSTWETQVGEFCIDKLDDQNFPYQIKVTCRDYMKRMMNSKLSEDEIFVAGTNVTDLIRAMARNSGITNQINVPNLPNELSSDLAYTRNTSRSDIAIAAAVGIGYAIYFNNEGQLSMEKAPDPTLDPTVHSFKTGSEGNLVTLTRSTDDSNLFNHVVVYGASDNASGIPYFGEALNTDPSSPTRILRIGDRYTEYQYDTVTSDDQAATLAGTFLKVSALETYQLSIDSIVYPWLDVNIVSGIIDPRAFEFEPTKYLLDTLTIPLTLGPMSGSAKRITLVGDSGDGFVDGVPTDSGGT